FLPGQLQRELGGLVDGLEEQLVAVHLLLGALLQGEQLVGAQVALVVACARAGEDRLAVVLRARLQGVSIVRRKVGSAGGASAARTDRSRGVEDRARLRQLRRDRLGAG